MSRQSGAPLHFVVDTTPCLRSSDGLHEYREERRRVSGRQRLGSGLAIKGYWGRRVQERRRGRPETAAQDQGGNTAARILQRAGRRSGSTSIAAAAVISMRSGRVGVAALASVVVAAVMFLLP